MAACPNTSLREMVNALRIRVARYEPAYMRDGDRESHAAPRHERILAALADGDLTGRPTESAASGKIPARWS